jgi:hypothetical protein
MLALCDDHSSCGMEVVRAAYCEWLVEPLWKFAGQFDFRFPSRTVTTQNDRGIDRRLAKIGHSRADPTIPKMGRRRLFDFWMASGHTLLIPGKEDQASTSNMACHVSLIRNDCIGFPLLSVLL